MRTSHAFLIFRFLTWPPAILAIVVMILFGSFIDALGLNKPNHTTDYVCIGQMKYDLNDPSDRKKLDEEMLRWEGAVIKAMQRPPCDGSGSPVSQSSINKFFTAGN